MKTLLFCIVLICNSSQALAQAIWAQNFSTDAGQERLERESTARRIERFNEIDRLNRQIEEKERKEEAEFKKISIVAPLWKIYKEDKDKMKEIANFFGNEEEAVYCTEKLNSFVNKNAEVAHGPYYPAYWSNYRYIKEKDVKSAMALDSDDPYYYVYSESVGIAMWKIYKKEESVSKHVATLPEWNKNTVHWLTIWLNEKNESIPVTEN